MEVADSTASTLNNEVACRASNLPPTHPYNEQQLHYDQKSSYSFFTKLQGAFWNLITNFEIKWFIISMGTGISSSILYSFPYPHRWLQVLGLIMFGICSLSLLILLPLFAIHIAITKNRIDILYDLEKNVFLGAFSMGITSWCSMFYSITQDRCIIFVWFLWWVCNVTSLFTAFFVVICILHKSKLASHEITPKLLLPIVTIMVSSAFGQNIFKNIPQNLKLTTLIFNFMLWSLAMCLSFIITTLYFYRMVVHKLPGKSDSFSSFITLGFLGQGSFSIQLFGENFQSYLLSLDPVNTSQVTIIEGLIFKNLGLVTGLFLEAFGLYLTAFAIAGVLAHCPHRVNFGWWAMTFPCGTMSLGFFQTYKLTGWEYSRVLSVIYAGILFATVGVNLIVPPCRFVKKAYRRGSLL